MLRITRWLPALLLLCALSAPAAPLTEVERTFPRTELREMCRDRFIDVTSEAGSVSLLPFELVLDSSGHTENGMFNEPLSDRVWAKKEFVLDDPRAQWAQLYFAQRDEKTQITINGRSVKVNDPKTWAYSAWAPVDVPVEYLKKGVNTIIFSGAGGLYVDNCLLPNRSARSVDGGKTWDYDHLGAKGEYNGEYMVRLGLGRYPKQGTLWSDGVDLAMLAARGNLIAPAVVPQAVLLDAAVKTGMKTDVGFELRCGPSPAYDPATWSAWAPIERGAWQPLPPTGRYVQWRAVLSTKDPLKSPLLQAVTLRARLELADADTKAVQVTRFDNQRIIRGSYNFVYQGPSSRVDLLRKQYKLDEVAAQGKTEFAQMIAVRAWTRRQWRNGWGTPGLLTCAPPDALLILDLAGRGKAGAFCGHYATAFVQCAATQGFTGRVINARAHAFSEMWVNDLRKWVLMDVGPAVDDDQALNYHYELNGAPLSTLEMHRRLLKDDWSGVKAIASNPADNWDPAKDPVAMKRYTYFCIPFRNNQLDSYLPGDIDENGWPSDIDWLLWRDGARQTLYPEYPYTTNREGDIYWTLNQVAISPGYAKPGALHLDFDTVTPNFDRYEVRLDGGAWMKTGAAYDWTLHAGKNLLEARTVNAFGKAGIVSALEVNYAK